MTSAPISIPIRYNALAYDFRSSKPVELINEYNNKYVDRYLIYRRKHPKHHNKHLRELKLLVYRNNLVRKSTVSMIKKITLKKKSTKTSSTLRQENVIISSNY